MCRSVRKGEELVMSYIPLALFPARQERQELLLDTWGFSCSCEVCSLEEEERRRNEEVRSKIRDLDESHDLLVKEGKTKEALEGLKEKVHLMRGFKEEAITMVSVSSIQNYW